ncbi:MAG TPA: hypothetical protein EYP34_10850 [Chromatiaceae bacterium]|nr:hypothetical protein [Chromatiaceae bacterium]
MGSELTDFVLGETSGAVSIGGFEDLKAHSCHMAAACCRRLDISAHRLNPGIYNQPCFEEAVRQLIIRHASTRIRILVADTEELARGGSRLVQLAQSMPGSMEIRRRAEAFSGDQRSFMLADAAGFILRNLWNDLNNARLDYNSPYTVRNLHDEFLGMWEQSEPDPGLRRLSV